jgi:hypothetical protein
LTKPGIFFVLGWRVWIDVVGIEWEKLKVVSVRAIAARDIDAVVLAWQQR